MLRNSERGEKSPLNVVIDCRNVGRIGVVWKMKPTVFERLLRPRKHIDSQLQRRNVARHDKVMIVSIKCRCRLTFSATHSKSTVAFRNGFLGLAFLPNRTMFTSSHMSKRSPIMVTEKQSISSAKIDKSRNKFIVCHSRSTLRLFGSLESIFFQIETLRTPVIYVEFIAFNNHSTS